MLRKGFLLGAALLLLPALLSAYTVVLKNGRRIEASSRYTVEGTQVKFVGSDGRAYQFALTDVDTAATDRANAPAGGTRSRAKVWMNEDLELLRGNAISVVGSGGAAAAAPAGGEGEAAGKGEAAPAGEETKSFPPKEDTAEYWQKRLKPVRDEMAQVDQQLQQLRAGQGQAASNSLSLQGNAPGADVQDTIRRLERRKGELQQQIEAIQAEAKRKGISPGAVR